MGVWVCPRVSVHAWVCHWVLGKVLRVRAGYEALGILGAMSVWLCMCLCVCLWVLAGKREVSDRCLELAIWKPPPVGSPLGFSDMPSVLQVGSLSRTFKPTTRAGE